LSLPRLRGSPAVIPRADVPIIIRRFEWWFKQCDESNLNCFAADCCGFGKLALSKVVPLRRRRSKRLEN
jgi:hypothetical protein